MQHFSDVWNEKNDLLPRSLQEVSLKSKNLEDAGLTYLNQLDFSGSVVLIKTLLKSLVKINQKSFMLESSGIFLSRMSSPWKNDSLYHYFILLYYNELNLVKSFRFRVLKFSHTYVFVPTSNCCKYKRIFSSSDHYFEYFINTPITFLFNFRKRSFKPFFINARKNR